MNSESYKAKSFSIKDHDARLRNPEMLSQFLPLVDGMFPTIPFGSEVRVDEVKILPAGSRSVTLFVHARPMDDDATPYGWTSWKNLEGEFLSETLGLIRPASGAGADGPNAAWVDGQFLGQINLVKIFGTKNEIEFIAERTCDEFLTMVTAARKEGVIIGVNSGFRTFAEQKHLHDGFHQHLPGFNPANPPGQSNHQSGIAFDLDVGGGGSNATYMWLQRHATNFGFIRTVRKEAWHWEFLPAKATLAKERGVFTTWD